MTWDDIPPVCFDDDLCRLFKITPRTLKRRRKQGAWPIPELPSLDRRHRAGRADVVAFLERRLPARGRTR